MSVSPPVEPTAAARDRFPDHAPPSPDRRFRLPVVSPPRPTWWSQIILAVGFAWGYDALRALHGNVRAAAIRNGLDVLRLDRDLHAGWVATLSTWIAHHDSLSDILAGYYVVMHLGAVALTLVVLWANGQQYRWHRDALLVLSAVSFAVFWFYPVAPPRLIGSGFPDTVRHVLPFAYRTEAAAANLYAAVPSLHVAWALWVAIALFGISRSWWVRGLGSAHVVLTIVTVLGTGNHYLVDVAAGAAVTIVGYALMPAVIAVARRIAPGIVKVAVPASERRTGLLAVAAEPATIDLVGAQFHDRERRGGDRG